MKYSIRELITEKISGEWGNEPVDGQGYKVIRTTNFTNHGVINYENIVTREVEEKKVDKKHLEKGDIIIEKSGGSPAQPVGRVVLFDLETDEKFLCNNFTTILRPNQDLVNPKYFLYQLHIAYRRGKTKRYQNKTTGIINLQLDKYLDEKIEVPSLPDQLHIATLLSKAENLIAQRKESIRLLDEYLKNTFLEMFGEYFTKDVVRLESVASITSGLTKGKKYGGKATRFLPYMRVANVQDGFLDLEVIKDIEATEDEIKRYNLKYGDLLLTEGGDPDKLGRGAIWKSQIQTCIFQNHIFRVRVIDTDKVNTVFLSYQTGSIYGKKYFLKSGKQTTGIASINTSQLKSFPVFIPPIDLQTRFAQIVEKTDALKIHYEESLQELEHLYGSLSQKAFRGELKLDEKEEGLLMAAEPELPYQTQRQLSIPPSKKGFAKLVLAGKIISECKESLEFTNIKFQKLQHLAEHLMEADLNLNYYNQAAGPYDNKFMHTLHQKMNQQKWFASKGYQYFPMDKANEIDGHFNRYFGAGNEQFSKLITLLGKASEDQCEIISTLYAVWNDRMIKGETVTDEALIGDFFNWSERKQKYSSEQLTKAIEWMWANGLEPKGFGELIKHSKKKG